MMLFSGTLLLPLAMLRLDASSHEQMKHPLWNHFAVREWILLAKPISLRALYQDLQVQEDLTAGVYGKWIIRLE